jgi:hypothetical protein
LDRPITTESPCARLAVGVSVKECSFSAFLLVMSSFLGERTEVDPDPARASAVFSLPGGVEVVHCFAPGDCIG